MMEFYNEKLVAAKKEHQCHICGGQIKPREKYYRENGVYEGYFFDRCTCISCHMARKLYVTDKNEREYDTWCIADHVLESFCSECLEARQDDGCGHTGPLMCPMVREHFEAEHARLKEATL